MTTFGSVCSGIEAASVAWHPLGWRAAWLAEIEAFPTAVLAHHFPDVPNLGDMTKLAKLVLTGKIAAPDVLVGGTPCQAFSVAGLREGLSDPRGQLTIKFVELADAIDHVRSARGDTPATIVWENVPGVLSDKSNAFGCFLGAISGEDCELQPAGGKWTNAGCVFGPKRAVAWRVLDAQFFGVAQRRRRVFVVASSRAGFNPAQVLFEFGGLRRDTAPRREPGQSVTHPVAPCLTSSGRGVERGGDTRGQDPVVAVAFQPGNLARGAGSAPSKDVFPTLKADHGRGLSDQMPHVLCMAHGQGGAEIASERSPTLTCNHEAPIVVHGTQDHDVKIDLAHTLGRNNGGENVIALQDTSSRDKAQNGKGWSDEGTSYTLDAAATQGVAYAFQPRIARNGRGDMGGLVNALTAQAGETGKGDAAPCVVYPILEVGKRTGVSTTDPRAGIGIGSDQHPMFTLQAGAQHGVAVAHATPVCVTGDITHTLKSEGFDGSDDGTGRGQPIVTHYQEGEYGVAEYPTSGTIRAGRIPEHEMVLNHTEMAVRRLTPIECERLQGFPDGWTLIPTDKRRSLEADMIKYLQLFRPELPFAEVQRLAADGPRYKALGNSMAVPVMRWIGERIQMVCDHEKQSHEVTA